MKKRPCRLAALLLAALLLLGCAGCSRSSGEAQPEATPEPQPEATPEPPATVLWQGLEFTLNGTPMQLPVTLAQLEALGFELVPYEGEIFWEILPGQEAAFFMTHPDCGPYHVLEGVLSNLEGGEQPVEEWSVRSITVTAVPQLENGLEPVLPTLELGGGVQPITDGYMDVFDNYGVLEVQVTSPAENSYLFSYNQNDRQQVSFLYLNVSPDSSPDFGSASLTLVPDGWLSEALAQSALDPDALAEGEYEQYDDLDAIDDPALLAAIEAAMG